MSIVWQNEITINSIFLLYKVEIMDIIIHVLKSRMVKLKNDCMILIGVKLSFLWFEKLD